MRRIPLTKGKEALVDDQDYKYLMQWNWHVSDNGFGNLYAKSNVKPTTNFMHIVITERMGFASSSNVDHRNGDGLDNRRMNLREATKVQNGRNRGPIKGSVSGYKGVHWFARDNRWRARIVIEKGREQHLGYFDDKIEAAKAYNKAAKKHFGEFAWLNPIPKV